MSAWGEAAWTARDLDVAYLVTDALGSIYGGEFATEDEAVLEREELIGMGIECWIVSVQRGSFLEEEYTC